MKACDQPSVRHKIQAASLNGDSGALKVDYLPKGSMLYALVTFQVLGSDTCIVLPASGQVSILVEKR